MIVNTPKTLDLAAEILDERGLSKGQYCDPKTGAVCFWGAIYAAAESQAGTALEDVFNEDGGLVHLTSLEIHFYGQEYGEVMRRHFGSLTPHEWNDLPFIKKAHVVRRLRELAAEMRKTP